MNSSIYKGKCFFFFLLLDSLKLLKCGVLEDLAVDSDSLGASGALEGTGGPLSLYSTYFDQFRWRVSLGRAVRLILPFIFIYSTMRPIFIRRGSLELVRSVGILSLSKVLCRHAWAKKAGRIHLLVMVGVVLFYCNMVGIIPFIKGVSVIPAFVLSLGFAV